MTPEDFAFDLARLTLAPGHLWVGSGRSTVHPVLSTVMAVQGFYSPPVAAPDLLLDVTLEVDGHIVHDWGAGGSGDVGWLSAGGRWMPDAIERTGTYHHRKDGHLRSLSANSRLVPLACRAGFLLSVELVNRSPAPCRIRVCPELKPGHPRRVPLSEWMYPRPACGTEEAVASGPGMWTADGITLRLVCENPDFTIPASGSGKFFCTVEAGDSGTHPSAAALESETRRVWQTRLDTYLAAVPRLTSSHRDLETYYQRSLISGLVCFWEHPEFAMSPHVATSGLDGGALCSYLWDFGGYAPQLLTLMLGDKAREAALLFARMDLTKFYAMAPDGHPVGVAYAYSVWSFVRLVRAICDQGGFNGELFSEAVRLVMELESRADTHLLVDFGSHDSLLEMRGAGWEHVVASPNAERAWCLRQLADLSELADASQSGPAASWRNRADAIAEAVRTHLWDGQASWFRCLHPDGHSEMVLSIQAFDALRAGVCSRPMKDGLLRHLHEDGFLGHYGVSSVARADTVHYEVNDPDWSGGGAYCGEGPQLAHTLYEAGEPTLAWDVLRRHFWMGRHYPYFPQESYADRPQSPPNKRANIVSGLTGAEAILFGLFGLQPAADGSLHIDPHPPAGETVSLSGLRHCGHSIDIALSPGQLTVTVDGKLLHQCEPGRVKVC